MNRMTYYLGTNRKTLRSELNFTSKHRVTYILRMHREGENMRRSWVYESKEQSHTNWGCEHKEKRSGGLHRSIKNRHLLAEGAQTRRKYQVDITEASRTVTYMLRVHRQGEKIRRTSRKHREQSLTSWGCADNEKRSGGLNRSIENSHVHTEDAQTRRKDQVDFTEASRTATHWLKVHRQGEKLR